MFRVARCTLVAASITLTLVACHDAAAPPHAGPALAAPPTMSLQANGPFVLHQVPPASTDPDIESEGKWLSDHFVWLYPGAERAEKLFVHLPGGANPIQVPASFQFLAGEAARLGYHVIVLTYPNDWGIENLCRGDGACEENVRLDIIDGGDRSVPVVDISSANSIENRLTKLLEYLAIHDSEEGWSQFLNGGAPVWSKIVMSGFSFGGSEAAMLAKLHRMDRVTLFAAPRDADATAGGAPPPWVALGATPADRYYGLVHNHDPLSALTLASWKGPLEMLQFGEVVREDVSGSAPATHMLLSDRLTASGTFANAHGSVATDPFTPLGSDGMPLLRYAWRYILGAPLVIVPPGDRTVPADPERCDAQPGLGAPRTVGGTSPVTVAASPPPPYSVGTTTVTWTATDGSTNTALATQLVTVQDRQPPTVTAPPDLSTTTDPGQATASVDPGSATASDNCPGSKVVGVRGDGRALNAPYPVGQTSITWTVTDASGNTAAAAQTVTVADREPPVLSVPADFTVNATSPSGAVVSYVASATDNVAGTVPVSCRPAPGSGLAIGTTHVTCMATDPSGNQASAGFDVTVLGAPAQIVNLESTVATLGLAQGIATSLTAKLDAALAAANASDVVTACTKLQDFINETQAQAGKKIATADATLLIADAERIRAVLGC